jgi:hypothetical protein
MSALGRNAINITSTHYTEPQQLYEGFGFSELAKKLSEFPSSINFKEGEDEDAGGRIEPLEKKANQHFHVIAMLQHKVIALRRFWASCRTSFSTSICFSGNSDTF